MNTPGANPELRGEYRLGESFTVFLESPSSALVITHSVDASANGIQIILDQPLPLQAIVRICLESHEAPHRRFLLSAEVTWAKQSAGQHLVGLQLLESSDTDIIDWKEYIAGRLMAGADI